MTTEKQEVQKTRDSCGKHPNQTNANLGKRIIINISGLRYETYDLTLERFPDSLLGSKQRRDKFFDHEKQEYFFDKNRICFESILAYYQTCGVLIRPPNIPRKVFVSDIKYFDLGEQALLQAGDDVELSFAPEDRPMPENKIQRAIWSIFEHPDTSNWARAMAILSVGVIVLSIVLFCVETLPQFQPKLDEEPANLTEGLYEPVPKEKTKFAFFVIEAMCIAWFTLEYSIRLLCCPNKWKFVVSVLNIIDLVAILPFFITLPMKNPTSVSSLAILRCVRLVRVFRIFKLSRYSRGLQILGHTLKASLRELGLLFFFLCVGVILFSSAVYYAEYGSSKTNAFRSIPHSFWWSIITMTTVGYGDMVPQTLGGKLVGCFCAITGVLAIALPVPVIVSNFAYYYSKEHSRRNGNNSANEDNEEREDKNMSAEKTEGSTASKFVCCCRRRKPAKTHDDNDSPSIIVKSEQTNIEMDVHNGNIGSKDTAHKPPGNTGNQESMNIAHANSKPSPTAKEKEVSRPGDDELPIEILDTDQHVDNSEAGKDETKV